MRRTLLSIFVAMCLFISTSGPSVAQGLVILPAFNFFDAQCFLDGDVAIVGYVTNSLGGRIIELSASQFGLAEAFAGNLRERGMNTVEVIWIGNCNEVGTTFNVEIEFLDANGLFDETEYDCTTGALRRTFPGPTPSRNLNVFQIFGNTVDLFGDTCPNGSRLLEVGYENDCIDFDTPNTLHTFFVKNAAFSFSRNHLPLPVNKPPLASDACADAP